MTDNQDPAADAAGSGFTSGSITLVLDAPGGDGVLPTSPLPKNFRSSTSCTTRRSVGRGHPEAPASARRQRAREAAPPEKFGYPFADERVKLVSHFYNYVCSAKPQRYAMTWSAWVAAEMSQAT